MRPGLEHELRGGQLIRPLSNQTVVQRSAVAIIRSAPPSLPGFWRNEYVHAIADLPRSRCRHTAGRLRVAPGADLGQRADLAVSDRLARPDPCAYRAVSGF